ncbi:hypothetical protein KJ616_02795 [Patescibacteria group bacterium]|nr:hypothetical protein [Patescibacteria group bacterium]
MRKYIATIAFVLIGFALIVPSGVKAVVSGHDDLTFDAATNLYLPGNGYYLTVTSGSEVQELSVGSTQLTLNLLDGSFITLTSSDKKVMTSSLATTVCGSTNSTLTISTSDTSGFSSVYTDTIGISGDCVPGTSGGGGGGGGGGGETTETTTTTETTEEPTITTTTGTATVTAASGGQATAITSGGGEAIVNIPGGAVSADTTVTVTPTATTESTVSSFVAGVTSGQSVVGGFVYNFSAESGGAAVTTFNNSVTITMTYTEAQIAGIDESTLTISYWDATTQSWIALVTTVDTANNTLTATTDHFTYFAIIGEEEAAVEEVIPLSQMTATQLRAKIAELLQTILKLQAALLELKGETGGVITGVPSFFSFTSNLKQGMSSTDVKYLQIILNFSSDTMVATTGVGSSGHETNYFGSLTKAAVIKFQEKYASEVLTPGGLSKGTGYVGSSTRAKLNTLLGK